MTAIQVPQPSLPTRAAPLLRLATVQDAPMISALAAHTFTTTFGYSLPPDDLSTYLTTTLSPSAITADILNPDMSILVAIDPSPSNPTDQDRITGFCQLTQNTFEPCVSHLEATIELQRLYVSMDYHGGGVGKALVYEIEAMARALRRKHIWLGVWEENLKAHKVYQRFGFEKCGEHDFVMGTCVQRDWIMWKKL